MHYGELENREYGLHYTSHRLTTNMHVHAEPVVLKNPSKCMI